MAAMNDFLRKNFALLLAFLLPIGLITAVALSMYLPSLFLSTDYDFVYTACTNGRNYYPYRCDSYLKDRYAVEEGKLVQVTVETAENLDEQYVDRIFLHDTKKNESREITLEEAQTLTLNDLLTSPDGITVSSSYDRRGGDVFFLFGGGTSTYGYYLTKGSSKSKINLINTDDRYYYRDNFRFIGWVLPSRNN